MSMPSRHAAGLKSLPSVDALLARALAEGEPSHAVPRELLLAWLREVIEEARASLRAMPEDAEPPARGREEWTHLLLARVSARRAEDREQVLGRVINATGVLLHTNLGRAPLSAEAQAALHATAAGYSNLEMDLTTGKRRSRLLAVRELLPLVTGAEAGLAVHNNAAAVYLALTALASGREVVISRGHLVEIGGGFRLPDIMAASGARLAEVGTTNRTRREDYARTIRPETGLILKIHPSNFRLVGFHEEVSTRELASLARETGVPFFEDLGSGALTQHGELAFGEPMVQDALRDGADLVAISGDKLLGGPQAGIIVGRSTFVELLAKHPVARVVRLDKTALAALEATLRAYLDPASLARRIPLLTLLSRGEDELAARAVALAEKLRSVVPWRFEVLTTRAEVGGGSLPGVELPSRAITIEHPKLSPNSLSDAFRRGRPPIAGRVENDRFLLDLRTVLDGEEDEIVRGAISLEGSA